MSTILVVDDLEPNRYILRVALGASGHRVLEAANGAEALAAARALRPDLIISDILMPQMDGFAFCRECKQDEQLRGVPFVFYTATYTSARDREFALQLGAARFYVKPVETADFVTEMHEVLDEHAAGDLASAPPPADDETTLYRLYNETLIRKLEDKMLDLERLNGELTGAQQQLHLAMAAGKVGLWDWDFRTGHVQFTDEWAGQIGYTPAGLGDSIDEWRSRLHPEDLPLVTAILQDFLLGDAMECSAEYRLRHRDGSYRRMLARASAIRDATGRRIRFAGAQVDITEYAQLQAQLLQSQKMESVGQLAGGIAHDFNNLLAVILMDADVALASLPVEHPVAADLREIRQAAERAAAMTRQLLAFSRREVARPERLDLNAAVREILAMAARLIGESITLRFSPAEDAAFVLADRSQIEQVVINLVINARDAMPAGGTLTVETRETGTPALAGTHPAAGTAGPWVVLSVSDTGMGMAEETRSHIFEPFFTTKEAGKGTGLGLSTVYGIVEQSGGTICVRSELNRGSTFEIYLPRVESAELTGIVSPQAAAGPGNETILLVEDDDILCRVAARVLDAAGYHVLAAATIDDAMRLVDAPGESIHLMVSSMAAPGAPDGHLAQKLAAAHPGARVLQVSSPGAAAPSRLQARAEWSLSKPYTAEQITHAVRITLDAPAP